ncbi:hypothetical protein [Billgrantia desiderata]|uniref:hypothetical protein n=1 Tax=Billgrantia desiderata TaxID=52021 RepID=UPI003F4195BF
MLSFGKDKSVKEWRSWIKNCKQLKNDIIDLKTKVEAAKKQAQKTGFDAKLVGYAGLEVLGVEVHNIPANELPGPDKVVSMLEAGIANDEQAGRIRGGVSNLNRSEAKKALNDLRHVLEAREEERRVITDLTQRLELAEERLETLEDSPPKAGHGALKAIDQELESARDELSRINAALEARHDTGGAVDRAQEEAGRAQERVDDLEAAAALGEVEEAERQAASAALTLARNKLADAKGNADRQAAASRGLQRQLEKVAARIQELDDLRAGVASEVHMEELEVAETQLVDLLGGDKVRELVETINASRLSLNRALNHLNGRERNTGPHSPLKVMIEASHLVAHPSAKDLNKSGIKF